MSKHPTSELSPRDRACIEYGQVSGTLRSVWRYRFYIAVPRRAIRMIISLSRICRERIFRTCDECAHEDAFDCTVRNERLCDCYGYKDYAPTCKHYKERRGAHE